MREVEIDIKGLTPYSAAKHFDEALKKGENKLEHEIRRWREKLHEEDGQVYIPGVGFKLAIDEAASLLNEKIVGKGNQTYTAQFKTSVVAMSDVYLGIKVADVKPIAIYANANGKRGPGTRVWRYFPLIPEWKGKIRMRLFNDTLSQEVFERFFETAGLLAGVGRGRPITGCAAGNGRFQPVSFAWS